MSPSSSIRVVNPAGLPTSQPKQNTQHQGNSESGNPEIHSIEMPLLLKLIVCSVADDTKAGSERKTARFQLNSLFGAIQTLWLNKK